MERVELTKSKYTFIEDIATYLDDPTGEIVISVINLPSDILIECVSQENWDKFCEEQKLISANKQRQDDDKEQELLAEACETILKTDPFGGVYNGFKLGEIYKINVAWVERALKDMKNTYITDRLNRIKKAVENGKISL